MSGDLSAGLRKIAARRAERRVGVATPPSRVPTVPHRGKPSRPLPPPVAASAPPPAPAGPASPAAPAAPAEIPDGRFTEIDGVRVFSVKRAATDLFPQIDLGGTLHRAFRRVARKTEEDLDRGVGPAAGCRLGDAVILDLETTGFWGCPIFLVGLLYEEHGTLVTHQFLARDYPEERAILHAAARLLETKRLLITFNGKSYDVPCFRERAVYHGVKEHLGRLRHVDVLHPARRRFRNELPDCRLQTLEREVVGIYRTGDVPSHLVPDVYHEYAATGCAQRIEPVLHHSRVDVLTTASLFAELIPR